MVRPARPLGPGIQSARSWLSGVLLIEAVGGEVQAPLCRIREAIGRHLAHLDVRIGWGSVGPGQLGTWQEAWRWAGQLLVAEAAVPAAA